MNRDCDFVDRWLDDWAAGRLDAGAAERVETHVASCDRCQHLAAIVRGDAAEAGWPAEDENRDTDDVAISQVLAKTTGKACARAETLLPALADGDLASDDREIVRLHLAHCAGCSRLLAALEEAHDVLPLLAEIEPPVGFTTRVLARTSHAPRRSPMEVLGDWWLRALARPRGSVELAYVGALLIVVLVGNPVAAFRDAGEQAGRLVASVPMERITERLPARSVADRLFGSVVDALANQINAIGAEITYRWLQAKAVAEQLRTSIAGAVNWVLTADWKAIFTDRDATRPPANKAPPKPVAPQHNRTVSGAETFVG